MDSFVAPARQFEAYVQAVSCWPAGAIEIDAGEDPSTAQLLLLRAARLLAVPVASAWVDGSSVLQWWRLTPADVANAARVPREGLGGTR